MNRWGVGILLGCWLAALPVAGEPPKASVLERYGTSCLPQLTAIARLPAKFWTQEKVIAGIQALYPHRNEICLLNKVLLEDRSERTAKILETIYGQPVTGSQLVIAARSFFPTWPEATREAGFAYEDLEVAYGTRVWTRDRLIKAIRLLNSLGIDIGTTAMGHDKRSNVETILSNAFGFRHPDGKIDPIGGQALYGAATKEFGNWPAALKASKLNPNKWNRRGAWTDRSVLSALRELNRNETALNVWSIMRDVSPETLATLRKHAKFSASGNGLVQAAVRRFGSWDKALQAAGLEPNQIRKYRATGLKDSPQAQLEFWSLPTNGNNESSVGGGKLLGRPEPDPVEVAEANELSEMMARLTRGLPMAEQQFTMNVVEIVMTADNYSSPAQIAREMRKQLSIDATADRVREALARLGTLYSVAQ